METEEPNYLTLKWGTIKSRHFENCERAIELLKEYEEIKDSYPVIPEQVQRDTPRQKEIICELIDLCDGDTIYLHWDAIDVSKEDAKKYVMTYEKG